MKDLKCRLMLVCACPTGQRWPCYNRRPLVYIYLRRTN